SIRCFTDDGRLDAEELGSIVRIAERDGVIDENEIRVLRNIISRIKPDEVDESMRRRLQEIDRKISAVGSVALMNGAVFSKKDGSVKSWMKNQRYVSRNSERLLPVKTMLHWFVTGRILHSMQCLRRTVLMVSCRH